MALPLVGGARARSVWGLITGAAKTEHGRRRMFFEKIFLALSIKSALACGTYNECGAWRAMCVSLRVRVCVVEG